MSELYGDRTVRGVTPGGTTVRRYVGDPFKPRPHLRLNPKSRRHFPIAQRSEFCIRAVKCANAKAKGDKGCAGCVTLYRNYADIKELAQKIGNGIIRRLKREFPTMTNTGYGQGKK